MRQNTTATMIWNGNSWTAAGAKQLDDLRSAYDNLLQERRWAMADCQQDQRDQQPHHPVTVRLTLSAARQVSRHHRRQGFPSQQQCHRYVSNAGARTAGASSTTFPAAVPGRQPVAAR